MKKQHLFVLFICNCENGNSIFFQINMKHVSYNDIILCNLYFLLKAFGKTSIPRRSRIIKCYKIRAEHKFFLALEDKMLLWRYITFRQALTLEIMLSTIISPGTKVSLLRPKYFTDDVDSIT